ncbi:MAG: methyltransferase domain-containing protein [Lachnospiraceae bacterium]
MVKDRLKNYIENIVASKISERDADIRRLEDSLKQTSQRLSNLEERDADIIRLEDSLKQTSQLLSNLEERVKGFDELKKLDDRFKAISGYLSDMEGDVRRITTALSSSNEKYDTFIADSTIRLTNLEKFDDYFADISQRLISLEEYVVKTDIVLNSIHQKYDGFNQDLATRLTDLEQNVLPQLHSEHYVLKEIMVAYDGQKDQCKEYFYRQIAQLAVQINELKRGISPISAGEKEEDTEHIEKDTNAYGSIDYFDFENHFRGSREVIKKRFEMYIPYLQGKKRILDIGCGRGEFLELVKEQGVSGVGVDSYEEFAEYCKARGLNVEYADALEYMNHSTSVDLIFAGQIVEHLKLEQLLELCRLSYERLESGGCLIIETPNPTSLAIYTNSFYIDPTHEKPVHPSFMEYCLRNAGFAEVSIEFPESSRLHLSIPSLQGEGITNLDAFNASMQEVSVLLYGSQDYVIIATKK